MRLAHFRESFERTFPSAEVNTPHAFYSLRLKFKKLRFEWYLFDPLRDVEGMLSVKKQKLLHLAYAELGEDEAYLEVGTWLGKSLIAAMQKNPSRLTFACDNFSEYGQLHGKSVNLAEKFHRNLNRYGLHRAVTFYNKPFEEVFNAQHLPVPVGAYFYDAAHDERSQYLGIKLVEPFLSDEALVIIDDWRFAPDSQSYAQVGTQRAISESENSWQLLHDLPARYNGDRALWWNGVAVFGFQRNLLRTAEPRPATSNPAHGP